MPNREEALRRIFEATGVNARLTGEQKQELLAHLEDAVEAKVGAGMPEMEAVGQAFAELGDLEKIAKQYPPPAPVAVTPEGLRLFSEGRALAAHALCFFTLFLLLGWFITPKFVAIFQQVKAPMPALTLMFLSLSGGLSDPVLAVLVALLGAGLVVIWRWKRIPFWVGVALSTGSVTLCAGQLVSLFLPLLSLLEGIGARR